MKTSDIAWAAGFIDGEGCFYHNGRHKCVEINQVTITPLKKLQDMFGGRLYGPRIGKNGLSRKPIWSLHINRSEDIVNLCTLCRPYFQVKSEDAQALLELAKTIKGRNRR